MHKNNFNFTTYIKSIIYMSLFELQNFIKSDTTAHGTWTGNELNLPTVWSSAYDSSSTVNELNLPTVWSSAYDSSSTGNELNLPTVWSSAYDSSTTACWLRLYIPYKTCGLQSASAQHKHSTKHEGSSRTPTPEKMCWVTHYQTLPPLSFYGTDYCGDLVAQSHGTLASKSVPK